MCVCACVHVCVYNHVGLCVCVFVLPPQSMDNNKIQDIVPVWQEMLR